MEKKGSNNFNFLSLGGSFSGQDTKISDENVDVAKVKPKRSIKRFFKSLRMRNKVNCSEGIVIPEVIKKKKETKKFSNFLKFFKRKKGSGVKDNRYARSDEHPVVTPSNRAKSRKGHGPYPDDRSRVKEVLNSLFGDCFGLIKISEVDSTVSLTVVGLKDYSRSSNDGDDHPVCSRDGDAGNSVNGRTDATQSTDASKTPSGDDASTNMDDTTLTSEDKTWKTFTAIHRVKPNLFDDKEIEIVYRNEIPLPKTTRPVRRLPPIMLELLDIDEPKLERKKKCVSFDIPNYDEFDFTRPRTPKPREPSAHMRSNRKSISDIVEDQERAAENRFRIHADRVRPASARRDQQRRQFVNLKQLEEERKRAQEEHIILRERQAEERKQDFKDAQENVS